MNKLFLLSLLSLSSLAIALNPSQTGSSKVISAPASCLARPLESSNSYRALQWYRVSAEQKAIYRQIFASATATIIDNAESSIAKKKPWSVVFSLDGTLLDNSKRELEIAENCTAPTQQEINLWARAELPALPGAAEATCEIQKKGGNVIIVSNRDGSEQSPLDMQIATTTNLKQEGICYSSLIFANSPSDTNKNPRFSAIEDADYENVIVSKKLPPQQIIAYVGNDIEDFPNFKQNTASTANKLAANADKFESFGEEYFILPNPSHGSWQNNQLK